MLVRVIKSFSLSGKYNPGDVAGFPEHTAERLVRQGLVTPHAIDAPEPAAADAAPARVIKADIDDAPKAKRRRRRKVKA